MFDTPAGPKRPGSPNWLATYRPTGNHRPQQRPSGQRSAAAASRRRGIPGELHQRPPVLALQPQHTQMITMRPSPCHAAAPHAPSRGAAAVIVRLLKAAPDDRCYSELTRTVTSPTPVMAGRSARKALIGNRLAPSMASSVRIRPSSAANLPACPAPAQIRTRAEPGT